MHGVIRSSGNYADNQERFEIWICLEEHEVFPFVMNERLSCLLIINFENYICGVRSTPDSGSWISPDLRGPNKPEMKCRLSEVLIKNGFNKNELVELQFDSSKKEFVINKLKNH